MRGVTDTLLDLHHEVVRLPRAERVASALAELLGPAATMLDVGAGDGRVGARVAEAIGAIAEGVDVAPQSNAAMPVEAFDGSRLPFADDAFEVVLLADVLHHAAEPLALLREALRVASRAVAVKDHFRWGPVSNALLLAMDVVGNRSQSVAVRGTYYSPRAWLDLCEAAGGTVAAQIWPLDVHGWPIRLATRSELQFAARVERKRS